MTLQSLTSSSVIRPKSRVESAGLALGARMRATALILTTIVMVANASVPARAEVMIDLWNDLRIGFGSGNFDATSFSGQIEDARLYAGDELILTASALDIESDGRPSDGNWKVRRLDMRDANFVADNLTAGHVLVENFDLGALRGISTVSAFDDGLSDNSSARIADVRYTGHSADVTVETFRTLPFSFNNLPNGTRYAKFGGFGIDGLTVIPRTISDDAQPYVDVMQDAGFTDVTMDLEIAQKTDLVLGELHSQQQVALGLRDLGTVQLVADVKLQLDTFDKLVAFGVGEPDAVGSVLDLLGEIELARLSLNYDDLGLVALAMQLRAVETGDNLDSIRQTMLAELQENVTDIFPRNGAMIYPPLEKIITQSGSVRLRVEPRSSVPLSNMLGFMIMPDLALDQLNVKLVHVTAP